MNQQTFPELNKFDILKIIKLLFRNIWIIVPCVILAFGIAYFYVRYQIPTYRVSATLLLKENSRGNGTSGGSYINSALLARNQNIQNELEIIKSYPIIEETIKNLDLEVSYYEFKDYRYYNIYKMAPFKVFIFKEHPQLVGPVFDIVMEQDGSYTLKMEKQKIHK